MDYKGLSASVYRVIRHPSQWTKKDYERVSKMATLLEEEIEAELAKVGLVSSDDIKVVNTIIEEKTEIKEQPQEVLSLMQRIILTEDEKVVPVPSKSIEIKPIIKYKEGDEKRYMVTIICNGLQSKPSFQIFKGNDIKETDFRTDQVTRSQMVYYAVIDTADQMQIRNEVSRLFIASTITALTEYPIDWIPLQYKSIWQERTKIK